jgi:CheY-like chemotaxis protein
LPDDPVKVLLADDHTMFREGLAGFLASYGGMEVVGSAPNGEVAVALAERTRPDVVLMQVQVPFDSLLPSGYALDPSDPDVLLLPRPDGTTAAVFSSRGVTAEGVLEAAGKGRGRRTLRGILRRTVKAARRYQPQNGRRI